ncbi:MAG: energy-coupling factor ABC transporter permease [Phycisphaerae bacterium]|nr:energy-coupling factor ABC transporter permease [Phycisphaerae bacterium]
MHMADALISPAVGGTLWLASAGLIAWCARKVRQTVTNHLVPMMGVLGAFIFAAQMINFSIPGTGSSGHLGGGLILAVLLGPHAAFLVIASVLTVQALFFADGGLLALGCNIFNMGFFPAFIAYPLIYRPMTQDQHGTPRAWIAAVVAAVVALQLGAFGVVLETRASGISELPFGGFLLLMQPIHLAIGVVEGLATAAVVAFVAHARPEALPTAQTTGRPVALRPVLLALLAAAVVVGGAMSWFASTYPDGLEWSIARVAGSEELSGTEGGLHGGLAALQEKTAFLPDYGFKTSEAEVSSEAGAEEEAEAWPAVSAGTSVSGLVGGLLTLVLAGVAGLALKPRRAAA